jgi:hypothetical protein
MTPLCSPAFGELYRSLFSMDTYATMNRSLHSLHSTFAGLFSLEKESLGKGGGPPKGPASFFCGSS